MGGRAATARGFEHWSVARSCLRVVQETLLSSDGVQFLFSTSTMNQVALPSLRRNGKRAPSRATEQLEGQQVALSRQIC